MISSDHFTLHEVAPGVYAALARPGSAAICNSTIVDLGDRTLVVDTFQTLSAADDLLAAARDLTGRSAALVVNTHWHGDHVGGNPVFQGAEILATPRTVELVAEHQSPDVETYTEEIDELLRFADERLSDPAIGDDERALMERSKLVAETALVDAPRWRLTLPTAMEGDLLEVVGSARTAEVLTFGGGHTESDAFVHLPADRLIVAGDLLFIDVHPRIQDGDPAAWAAILDRIAALGPIRVVPGHGPLGGPNHLVGFAEYLRQVADLVADTAAHPGSDPAQRHPVPEGSETWGRRARLWEDVRALAERGGGA